jgi:hypothetical protein
MLSAVQCPFCGSAMRRGWMTTRGLALYPQIVSVNWLSDYQPREESVLLAPRGFRRPRRGANCCPECEAVILDPKVVDEERT